MISLHIVYASTTGNTEYVVDTLMAYLAEADHDVVVERQRAECVHPKDLLRGDVLLLGCGTWNTGGREGQLNPHMHALLVERARGMDLHGKPAALISLGDQRYYYRARCTEHLMRFLREHNGTLFLPPLVLLNEPYGQEGKVCAWGGKLLAYLRRAYPTVSSNVVSSPT